MKYNPRRRAPRVIDEEPITLAQLTRVLFGNQINPEDTGVIGRLTQKMDDNTLQVKRLLRVAWTLIILLFTAVLGIAVDAILRITNVKVSP